MRRRGEIHGYDIALLAIAAVIVYPDRVVEWLSEAQGRVLGIRTLIAVEAAGIIGMLLAMAVLIPLYPQLAWWHPLVYVGILASIRLGLWCVRRLFGFDE